jgi:hypothetical protein
MFGLGTAMALFKHQEYFGQEMIVYNVHVLRGHGNEVFEM